LRMSSLADIIKSNLNVEENHPAIVTSSITISYQDLNDRIRSAAVYLHSIGIRQHTKVAILSSNNISYVVYVLALWSLNACIIPLNIRLSDPELIEIINFSDAEFLFCGENEKRNLSLKIPAETLTFSPDVPDGFETPETNPDDISLIMFTSGATGKPKGVMHSLNDLIHSADNGQNLLSQTRKDKWLASLPFYHIGGISIIIRSLRFGSTLAIPDSLNNTDLRNAIDILKPSLASLVPTQLKRLLESGWKPGKELRHILLGGGFTEEGLINDAVNAGCVVSNVYGSTETSAFVTAIKPEQILHKPLSAGKALGRNKLVIVDEVLNDVKTGTAGEICVEGDSLFQGYYKDKDETDRKLIGGKYLTGDIGFIDEDSDLFVQARRTDLIITGGENVNPLEVENVLNKMSGIEDSCVVGLQDKEWGQIVTAALVMKKDLTINEISDFLKGKISSYKIPKKIYRVEKIPRSSLGKILRDKVKEEILSNLSGLDF
jgi:O-succinylbenzoic acid--CoA ligase